MKKLLILIALASASMLQAQGIVQTRVVGNASLTNALIVSTKPTKLYSVTGYNSGAAQYIQIFNTATNAPNGTVPIFSINVPTQSYFFYDFSYYGADMDKISIANSTTSATLTRGAADCGIQAIIRAN